MHRVVQIDMGVAGMLEGATSVHMVYLETMGLTVQDVGHLKRCAAAAVVVAIDGSDNVSVVGTGTQADGTGALAALQGHDDRLCDQAPLAGGDEIDCERQLVDAIVKADPHANVVYVACRA